MSDETSVTNSVKSPCYPKRPLRLWVVSLMNVLVGILSLAMVVFLVTSDRVPESLQLSFNSVALASAAAGFLISASLGALYGNYHAAKMLLIAAFAFYGPMIAQNASVLLSGEEGIIPTQKLLANVFRNSLELLLNVWMLRSRISRQFFEARLRVGGAKV